MANSVVDSIAQEGSCDERHKEGRGMQGPKPGKCTGSKKERIARQKGRQHKACLRKDDCEQDAVCAAPMLCDDHAEVFIQMQRKIQEPCITMRPVFASVPK